jgi:hypothetical protein
VTKFIYYIQTSKSINFNINRRHYFDFFHNVSLRFIISTKCLIKIKKKKSNIPRTRTEEQERANNKNKVKGKSDGDRNNNARSNTNQPEQERAKDKNKGKGRSDGDQNNDARSNININPQRTSIIEVRENTPTVRTPSTPITQHTKQGRTVNIRTLYGKLPNVRLPSNLLLSNRSETPNAASSIPDPLHHGLFLIDLCYL